MGIDCPDWLCRECEVCDLQVCTQECDVEREMNYKRRCSDCFLYPYCYPQD